MKRYIIINFAVEGLHNWPEAKQKLPEVAFLSDLHRHMFSIKCQKAVSHNDRDVEIIMFKREMMQYLYSKYKYKSEIPNVCHFGRKSCEDLAEELVNKFDLMSCEVLEDNENGALVIKSKSNNILAINKKQITFVCGAICSGKSTLSQQLASLYDGDFIEVSDLIKEVLSSNKHLTRNQLQNTAHLDSTITQLLFEKINDCSSNHIYISGVRQVFIIKRMMELCKESQIQLMWLDVSEDVRLQRYLNREVDDKDPNKTESTFNQANRKDYELGLGGVKQFILSQQ